MDCTILALLWNAFNFGKKCHQHQYIHHTICMLPGRKAAAMLGVSQGTLRIMSDEGNLRCIRLPSGHRRYDLSGYEFAPQDVAVEQNTKYAYCRVSRQHQKEDLQRQVEYMQDKFPGHIIITDIGSGINFKRQGLQTILRQSMLGNVSEVVVAYKDRLARVAGDLLEWIFTTNNTKLVVLNHTVESLQGDLAEDLMAIVNVFCCRANGQRRYSKKHKKDENTQNENKEESTCKLHPKDQDISEPRRQG